jgi:hypothetical protein
LGIVRYLKHVSESFVVATSTLSKTGTIAADSSDAVFGGPYIYLVLFVVGALVLRNCIVYDMGLNESGESFPIF